MNNAQCDHRLRWETKMETYTSSILILKARWRPSCDLIKEEKQVSYGWYKICSEITILDCYDSSSKLKKWRKMRSKENLHTSDMKNCFYNLACGANWFLCAAVKINSKVHIAHFLENFGLPLDKVNFSTTWKTVYFFFRTQGTIIQYLIDPNTCIVWPVNECHAILQLQQ